MKARTRQSDSPATTFATSNTDVQSPEPRRRLITGASGGIGALHVDRFARVGHDLILVARNGARLETLTARLRAETGRSVTITAADLTDPAGSIASRPCSRPIPA